MGLQEPERPFVPEPLPTEPRLHLSESLEVSWSRSMLERVPEWSESFSRWRGRRRHASSSSMKLMLLVGLLLTMVLEVITRSRELCWSSLLSWTVSMPEEISRSCSPPTGLRLWILLLWDLDISTERSNSPSQILTAVQTFF